MNYQKYLLKQKKIIKNKRTGKVYASKDEFQADVLDPNTDTVADDFRQDLEIKVTRIPMGIKTKKIMEPRGATEIQHELLEKYVNKELLDKVQICTSIPGKVPLDPNKINILWQKNSYDQGNLQPFLQTKKDSKNMTGMYLTVIGTMKNLDTSLAYLKKNVL